MNGHVLEYATLSGSGHINGGIPGGYGHGALIPQGCHHLHHKLPNGLTLLNGTGSLYSRGHDGTLAHGNRDCEHSHPHHHHNVSVLSRPQLEAQQHQRWETGSKLVSVLSPGWGHVHSTSPDRVIGLYELSEPLQQQQVQSGYHFQDPSTQKRTFKVLVNIV